MHQQSALIARLTQDLDRELAAVDRRLAEQYPGRRAERQPIHTVYVPADRFSASTVAEWGAEAARILDANGDDAAGLAGVVGLPIETGDVDDADPIDVGHQRDLCADQ